MTDIGALGCKPQGEGCDENIYNEEYEQGGAVESGFEQVPACVTHDGFALARGKTVPVEFEDQPVLIVFHFFFLFWAAYFSACTRRVFRKDESNLPQFWVR